MIDIKARKYVDKTKNPYFDYVQNCTWAQSEN